MPTGKIWTNVGKREGETCSSCLYRSRDLKGRGASEGSWEGQQKPQGPASAVQEASFICSSQKAECSAQGLPSSPASLITHRGGLPQTHSASPLAHPPPAFRSFLRPCSS